MPVDVTTTHKLLTLAISVHHGSTSNGGSCKSYGYATNLVMMVNPQVRHNSYYYVMVFYAFVFPLQNFLFVYVSCCVASKKGTLDKLPLITFIALLPFSSIP